MVQVHRVETNNVRVVNIFVVDESYIVVIYLCSYLYTQIGAIYIYIYIMHVY